jgi:hypothetical protein
VGALQQPVNLSNRCHRVWNGNDRLNAARIRLSRLWALSLLAVLLAQAPLTARAAGGPAGGALHGASVASPSTASNPFGIVDAYQYPQQRAASGAGWERVEFWWNEIQPDDATQHLPPKTISDAQLQTELNAGMSVVGLLGNPPAWATRDGSTPANLSLPIDDPRNGWAAFVRYMVTTYAGRINQWIIWNEPDIPAGMQGSTWAGTVHEYYQLVKDAAEVAKAIDPSEQIIVAGTTYWVDITRNQPLFIDRLAAVAAADPTAATNNYYFDAVDLHVYSRASDVMTIAQVYRQTLLSHGIDKPLWLSESNVAPYDDPATPRSPDLMHDTMAEQADFVIEAFAYGLAAGVQRLSIYRMADDPNDQSGPWGLLHYDGTPRPAFQAFQTAVQQFNGASNVQYKEQPYLASLSFDRGSDKVWLFWATGTAPVQGAAPLLGNAAVVIDKNGASSAVNLPTSGVQPQVGIPVPGSLSHSDNGGPQNTRVGGDPLFLVESGIGQGIPLADGSQYFPQTGHAISATFLSYVLAHGGVANFGDPTDEIHDAGGVQEQQFQQMKLRTHPQFANSDFYIEAAPANAPFAVGAAYAPFRPVAAPPAGSGVRFFPQTGHTVGGTFLQFFQSNGGVMIFGYPRTEAFQQNGRLVQWFQRDAFEEHSENAGTPYEVQLRLLGSLLTAGRTFAHPATSLPTPTTAGAGHTVALAKVIASAVPTPAATPPPVVDFPQTGYSVGFGFLQFFQTHGGVNVFGYPISQEIPEMGPDGRLHTVQYFQRARFEYHPEFNGTPYEVELGLLGDQYLGLK